MRTNKKLQEIGTRLEKLREQLNYSREDMATQCEVTESGYSKNERGESLPKLGTLERLSKKYDLSMDWLFFGKGPMLFKEKAAEEKKEPLEEKQPGKTAGEKISNLEQIMPDVRELLEHMEQDPLLRYKVLVYFYEYKKESAVKM